jgi:hypothetical protein
MSYEQSPCWRLLLFDAGRARAIRVKLVEHRLLHRELFGEQVVCFGDFGALLDFSCELVVLVRELALRVRDLALEPR